MIGIHRPQMTVAERRQSNANRIDLLDAEVSGMKRSLAEQGELMRALMERAEITAAKVQGIVANWPEAARPAVESGSASPSILRRPRAAGGAV